MNHKIQKTLTILLFLSSIVLMVIGAGFIAMYIWEGIIVRIGEPDQSLIFWYLPVLFIGLFGLIIGITLFIQTFKKLKNGSTTKHT